MSLIDPDDHPAVPLIMTTVMLLALCAVIRCAPPVNAQVKSVRLRGTLSATTEEAEAGRFTLTGAGQWITVDVSGWDYLTDYMRGTVGHRVTVTLTPE